MAVAVPALDQDTCSEYTELQRDIYNTYPFWLAKTQVERRKTWSTFSKLTKKRPWKPNMGPVMKGIRKNPSPHLRQFVDPMPLNRTPLEDIVRVTETASQSILYWQDFASPALDFLPDFQDFMSHTMDHGEDLLEKIDRFEELFYRGYMFHASPFVFIAEGNSMRLVPVAPFIEQAGLRRSEGVYKSTAILLNLINAYAGNMSHLTLASLASGLDKMSVNLGIPPFSGSGLPAGDDKALDERYCLVTGGEAWNQFSFDPYLQQHKNCDLDVVNGSFKGSIFGRITSKLESLPLHMKADGTFAEPELEVVGNDAGNENEPIPNPEYAEIENSEFAISYMFGKFGYESITVGAPPSAFTGDKPPRNFPAMKWNGEVYLTKDFLIECPDPVTGEVRPRTNSKGRKVRHEGTLAMGCFPLQRRNVIPIIHKRRQGI